MLIIQFTGLSGSGKTTLASAVRNRLGSAGLETIVLDGDDLRKTISADLGFSRSDRLENMRRAGALAASYANKIVIIAMINPYEEARKQLRENYGAKLVWIACPVSVTAQRDPKGLYKRAALPPSHQDKVSGLTGVSDPFEVPLSPDLVINTHLETVEASTEKLFCFISSLLLTKNVVTS
ncbi:adenylyl-sulfate kinase [Hufsiella ginkgonis]|uniref:Adenylyl-sulfate kinase n=1 Tax=Hufsiella ginkgonis TaxID=2695274 RepID=A0A7K1Y1G2_9SPHI|nr:adenylyl-sulfate kinase [Hufsiella ginkgonis]MXV17042.1 adenylyl-sulfate kinase [Hufsiella ginkgonis]